MTTDAEPRPKLDCPSCGEPLVEATSRGRYDRDGNFIDHGDGCRCRHCVWMWFDDTEPVTCSCGARARVEVDDERAYTSEVKS